MPSLPEPISDELLSENFGALLVDIGVEYNMDPDAILALSGIVWSVFKGQLPPKQLAQQIQQVCNVDDKRAFQITNALKEHFLDRHKGFLSALYRDSGGYFQEAMPEKLRKPSEHTPKLDGNVVNLKGS